MAARKAGGRYEVTRDVCCYSAEFLALVALPRASAAQLPPAAGANCSDARVFYLNVKMLKKRFRKENVLHRSARKRRQLTGIKCQISAAGV